MAEHTPGPWTVYDHPTETCQIRADRDGRTVASVYMTDFPDGEANARLVAAAPELLEAAEILCSYVDQSRKDYKLDTKEHGLAVCLNNRGGDMLRTAIKKAVGEANG